MAFFYWPYAYTLHTRLRQRSFAFAWIFTYLVPVALIYALYGGRDPITLMLCVTAIYTLYEVGYMVNDAVLTAREEAPTLRLSAAEQTYYLHHRRSIAAVRVFTAAALLGLTGLRGEGIDTAIYAALGLAIPALYWLYNRVRSRWSIPLYCALVYLRYFMPAIPLFDGGMDAFMAWLFYPALAMIEFASRPRYEFAWLRRYAASIDRNRVFYYLALLALAWLGHRAGVIPALWMPAASYMLVYRASTYALAHRMRR